MSTWAIQRSTGPTIRPGADDTGRRSAASECLTHALATGARRAKPARPASRSIRLRAQSTMVSSIGRADQPSLAFAFSAEKVRRRPRSPTTERKPGSNLDIARTTKFGTWRVGTFSAAGPSRSRRISATSTSQRNGPGGHEPLAGRLGRRHRPDLQIGHVADVDEAEAEPGRPGIPFSILSITCSEYDDRRRRPDQGSRWG